MRMIPEIGVGDDVGSRAELRVARLLGQALVDDQTSCLHSLRLPVHEYKRSCEIDFLVVWDDTVLVIEVKGGRLRRVAGIWTVTDRYGRTTRTGEGPFRQAQSAMHALEQRLADRVPGLDVAFGILVVTPDVLLGDDVEWDPAQYAGPGAMSVAGIERALQVAREFCHRRTRGQVRGGAHADLMRVLRPDFDRIVNLSGTATGLEESYIRLADRQYDLLVGAERNRRIICTGGAGSGKTLLALETARRAASAGDRVLVVCASPELIRDLRRRSVGTGVVCKALDELDRVTESVDVLVVDEAQDVMDRASMGRLDRVVTGGLDEGRWRIFCDVNRQADLAEGFDRALFDRLTLDVPTIDLPYNCRNTATVVAQTTIATGADLGVARAGQGPPVGYVHAQGAEAARHLDGHLDHLVAEGVDPGDVVVVTVADDASASCATSSRWYRSERLAVPRDASLPVPGVAGLVTVRQFKGLEAAHVCIIDVDGIETAQDLARLYVAMTRPRISLWLAVGHKAWEHLAGTVPVERTARWT